MILFSPISLEPTPESQDIDGDSSSVEDRDPLQKLATLVAPPGLVLACLPLHPRLGAQTHPLEEASSSRPLPALLEI